MTDPHEIIEAALADAHDIDMTDDLYAAEILRKLEAAGFRLLSAEVVTDEMFLAIDAVNNAIERAEFNAMWQAILASAPLFGKGSEKK